MLLLQWHLDARRPPEIPHFSRAPCRTFFSDFSQAQNKENGGLFSARVEESNQSAALTRPAGTGGTAKIREFRLGALAGFVWDPLKWRKNMKSNLKLKAQAHSELPTAPVLLLKSSIKVLCSECTREAINGDVRVYSDQAEEEGGDRDRKDNKADRESARVRGRYR